MGGSGEPEVFTRAWKLKGNLLLGGLALAALCQLIVIPILGQALLNRWGVGPTVALAAFLFGDAMLLLLVGGQRLPMALDERLRRGVAAALTRRLGHSPDDGNGYFVGWTGGGPTANLLALDMSDDVGFVKLTPERLVFLGDGVTFELPRQQVQWIGPAEQGVPVIMDFGLRVVVHWVDQLGREQAFTFHRREARWKSQRRRLNEELCEVLRQWHQHGLVPGPTVQGGTP